MADLADLASEFDFTEKALIQARAQPLEEFTRNGTCRNCGEPVATGLFCDADCREDHERIQRIKGRLTQ